MSEEQTRKKARKGTKSCIECRQRKVRCIWLSEAAESCQNCQSRRRTCTSQIYGTTVSESVKLTSGERIKILEKDVATLWATIRQLENKIEVEGADQVCHKEKDIELGRGVDSQSTTSSEIPSSPSNHLRKNFDNELIRLPESLWRILPPETDNNSIQNLDEIRKKLHQLMPSKRDVSIIVQYASTWLPVLQSLFPFVYMFNTGSDMFMHYEEMKSSKSSPVAIANMVLSLAITIQHIPSTTIRNNLTSIKDGSNFVKQVSNTTERLIIDNDMLLSTLEGIETALLFLRLQLVRFRIRKVWIILRRIIAFSELIGLPNSSNFGDRQQIAFQLWESIKTVDRVAGMIFNLPLGTAAYPFSISDTIIKDGKVIPSAFLGRLGDISKRIQEVDELFVSGGISSNHFERVLKIDHELQILANLTPSDWWNEKSNVPTNHILQFWHQYLILRTHLQLVIQDDESNCYAYNQIRCMEACQNMAQRFSGLRRSLSVAFFAGNIFDLQVFTAATFLLYACYRPNLVSKNYMQSQNPQLVISLVHQIVKTLDYVNEQSSEGDFSRYVATVIRSLLEYLEDTTDGVAPTLTLSIPLLGRIRVGRQTATSRTNLKSWIQIEPHQGEQLHCTSDFRQAPQTDLNGTNMLNSGDVEISALNWIMDDGNDFSLISDEEGRSDQWQSFTTFG